MTEKIVPARRLCGEIAPPGDKSISHRWAMLAAIAEGASRIRNYSTGADCASTLGALRALGVPIERHGNEVLIRGGGLMGLRQPAGPLDAGNSGSTIRMLSGLLAAQPFTTRIGGDESLSRRPMDRIMKPLALMGAGIRAREGRYPPLDITGRPLRPIDYPLPVASAQVKTCVLFAGLYAPGRTVVREPVRTRDHTELALREFGAEVEAAAGVIAVQGRPRLQARELTVPGDLSSAAFFIAAGLLLPSSHLVVRGVGLNPTRTALIDFLAAAGADLRIANLRHSAGERVGDLEIRGGEIRGGLIEKETAAALIDEIPVLAVLFAASRDGLIVRDAAELRIKETDRIATVAENLRRMGAEIQDTPDGFRLPGRARFRAAALNSFGDHRIAMAFAVAALAAGDASLIEGAEAAAVSYPEFFAELRRLAE